MKYAIAPTLVSCLLLSFGSCSLAFVNVAAGVRVNQCGERAASETLMLFHHDNEQNDIDRRTAISRAIRSFDQDFIQGLEGCVCKVVECLSIQIFLIDFETSSFE